MEDFNQLSVQGLGGIIFTNWLGLKGRGTTSTIFVGPQRRIGVPKAQILGNYSIGPYSTGKLGRITFTGKFRSFLWIRQFNLRRLNSSNLEDGDASLLEEGRIRPQLGLKEGAFRTEFLEVMRFKELPWQI